MNKLLLFILTLLCACSETGRQTGSVAVTADIEDEVVYADTTLIEPEPLQNEIKKGSLLSLFPPYNSDTLTVEVSDKVRSGAIEDVESIPLEKRKYLEGFLSPWESRPLGRLKIGKNSHLLTLFQLDDYGPIYYGLTYDEKADKIISKEIIAQEWGDAGDSQFIKSYIQYQDGQVQLIKQIKTCHLDIDTYGIDPEDAEMECTDSIATVIINKNLEFEIIK